MNLTMKTLLQEIHPDIAEKIRIRGWPKSRPISLATLHMFQTKQRIIWLSLVMHHVTHDQLLRLEQTLAEFAKIDRLVRDTNIDPDKRTAVENLMKTTYNIGSDNCFVSRVFALWSTGDESILNGIESIGLTDEEIEILFS